MTADRPLPIPANQTLTPLIPCGKRDCQRFAVGTICLLVPYEGKTVPRKAGLDRETDMEPLQLFLGVDLCKEHGAEARAADFINPEMERAVIRAAIEFGRPKPDFSRAITGGRPLDDPKYLGYKAQMAAAKKLAKPEGSA